MNIVSLSPDAIIYLAEAASRADAQGKRLRVAVDGHTFKYKVGEGSWSAPFYDQPDEHRDNGQRQVGMVEHVWLNPRDDEGNRIGNAVG